MIVFNDKTGEIPMGDRGIQHGDKTGGNEYQIRNQRKKLPLVPSFI